MPDIQFYHLTWSLDIERGKEATSSGDKSTGITGRRSGTDSVAIGQLGNI
jgi:hypothetical protein